VAASKFSIRSPSDSISEFVDSLAQEEGSTGDDVQAKWLYLVLAWLFENREDVSDPLGW
jgi:hypothetical protein